MEKVKKVTVYSGDGCNYCLLMKTYLEEKGVEYEEKNIRADKEARKELIGMGYMTIPLTVIEGEDGQVHHVQGFNKDEISKFI